MGRSITQLTAMLEDVQPARSHLASGGGAVMLEHLRQCLPEQIQIAFIESGLFGKEGRHKAVGGIQAIPKRYAVEQVVLLCTQSDSECLAACFCRISVGQSTMMPGNQISQNAPVLIELPH